MTVDVECVVVGAGVVGLAVARAMAIAGRDTLVLESETQIGSGTSSRNSEVIHAGIYYPRGSRKAQLCVHGRQLLYRYCEEHGVAYRRCGKLIVANSDQEMASLQRIRQQAADNGVTDLAPISAQAARDLEPALQCVGALVSPSTGIIDSHGLMLSLQGELEAHGGMVAFASPVLGAARDGNAWRVAVGGAEPTSLRTRILVNAAGLFASRLAAHIDGLDPAFVPPTLFAKGNYYSLAGRSPFSRLIYPVPEAAGLGVHLTIDLAGQARFGPDVEWIDSINYTVDPRRADGFYREIRRYWPGLPDGALAPAYAGIRPKLQGPGQPARDFEIDGPLDHGVAGLVNLFGIESPGLTASLAIADQVAALVA